MDKTFTHMCKNLTQRIVVKVHNGRIRSIDIIDINPKDFLQPKKLISNDMRLMYN